MADTLNVVIGADTTGLDNGLSQARRLLSNFANAITTAARNVGEFALSLIGPQGVALGLTAIGTALVKGIVEYGSFSAAVRSLTGDLTDQEKAQKTLREEFEKGFPKYAQQTGQLSLLASLANDNTIGIRNQTAAQGLLRQEVDKVVKSQDLQKSGTMALSGEMLDYSRKVLLARVTLQGFNAVVSKSAQEFASAVVEGVTFSDYFVSAAKKIFGFTNALREGNLTLAKQIAETDFATIANQRYQDRVKKGEESLKAALKATEDYTRSALQNGIQLEDLLDTEVKVATAKTKNAEANRASAKGASDNEKEQRRLAKTLEEQRKEWALLQQNFAQITFPVPSDKEIDKLFRLENPPEVPQRQFAFDPIALITAQINAENAKKKQDEYNQSIQATISNFNDLLAPAINTIFGALENGQNVFQALKQSLKALIVQLAATVAKAAILALILSAISGGGFALGAAGSVAGGTGNFGGIFKNLIGSSFGIPKKAAAPTFSGAAGINGGGIQLAGQVVFVQRGPDLVGVLNQGNARIGRVG